ncbi:MAG: 7-carboxy-7-deazaguanine synthase QueE [Elusimicrobiales bacterium]|nr:7-carboxy-7-deazaguanine synthase QueE [Elusimicrobiales bacterium]MCK5106095.1 7-carboxy-7-deazaguanine synthase QueE [Elusimicrobiales bacterium]
MIKAKISEIFCSIQGEGLYLGQKQIFVRFAGCNLDCDYCDESKAKDGEKFSLQSPEEVVEKIKLFKKKENPEAVSLTGGEPLLQMAFIEKLLPLIKKTGLQIHLETNAVLFKEFEKIAEMADVIAADIKLPSATGKSLWTEHEEFLRLAPEKIFVKIVVTSKTKLDEIQKAFEMINKISPKMPVFIQPVTESGVVKKPGKEFFDRIEKISLNMKMKYKILPQQHPIWGIR